MLHRLNCLMFYLSFENMPKSLFLRMKLWGFLDWSWNYNFLLGNACKFLLDYDVKLLDLLALLFIYLESLLLCNFFFLKFIIFFWISSISFAILSFSAWSLSASIFFLRSKNFAWCVGNLLLKILWYLFILILSSLSV